MTRVQILFMVALVLAPLLSLLMRAVKRRLEGGARRDGWSEAPSVPASPRTPPVPAIGAGARPRGTPAGRATGVAATSVAAGGRAPSGLGTHREVRRGIVLMTVLGTCRALEPPGA